eukprot:CAMPEP_0113978328 /NCGR_PEP_ID=MMETSP0328-20130328/2312_1 /TAXON_ID=39455 /ORGANISM="Alexandrium minutum" /LENGTH=35 /assembly_acc=CAM_ASM_000350
MRCVHGMTANKFTAQPVRSQAANHSGQLTVKNHTG